MDEAFLLRPGQLLDAVFQPQGRPFVLRLPQRRQRLYRVGPCIPGASCSPAGVLPHPAANVLCNSGVKGISFAVYHVYEITRSHLLFSQYSTDALAITTAM